MGAITIVPIAAACAIKLNRKIEDTMAPAMFFVVTVLYLSGIISFFLPGVDASYLPGLWLLHLTVLICLGYTVVVFFKNRARFSASVLTCGLAAYGVFLIYFFLISVGRDPFMGDDLHHWAAAVRDYHHHKYLTAVAGNLDSNYMYPPILPVWNVYSIETAGRFHDWILFFSHNMLCGILSLPVFTHLSPEKKRKNILLLAFAVILIPLITGIDMPYGNLHDAIPHGFLAAYIIWKGYEYHLSQSRFDLISVMWAVCILSLMKEIAFPTALVCILVLFINDLINNHSFRGAGRAVFKAVLLSFCAGCAMLSWQFYLNRQDATYAAASLQHLVASRNMTATILQGDTTSTRIEAIVERFANMTSDLAAENWRTYMHMMAAPDTAWLNHEGLLQLSASSILLLPALAVFLLYRRSTTHSSDGSERSVLRIAFLALFLATPLGLLVRGLVYLTAFEFKIGVIFGAHTAPYCILAMLISLYCIVCLARRSQSAILAIACLFLLMMIHPLHPLMLILDKPKNTILSCAKDAGITFTADDYIYRLSGSTAGFGVEDHDLVHYYAWPAVSNQRPKYNSLPSDMDPDAYIMSLLSSTGATYLYTGALSPELQSASLPQLSGGQLSDYSLYRVDKTDGLATGLTFIGRDLPNAYSYRINRHPPELY